jgi:hypothetical protein
MDAARGVAATLIVEAQRVLSQGPSLEEALGVAPDAARKRLERARRELRVRLRGKEQGDDDG